MREKQPGAAAKLDRIFQMFAKALLCVGAAVLIFVMLVAFVDVIIAKIFGSSIQFATEIIQFCDLPLAYLGMGYTLLIGQMTGVDILFGKFSPRVQRVLQMIYDVIGTGFCVFFGKLSADNMAALFAKHTMANPKGGFPVWPFALVETVSWFVLAVAFVFCFLRSLLNYTPAPDFLSGPADLTAEGPRENQGEGGGAP